MSTEVKNRFLVILLLGLLSAVGPFSIDMYLPGFESMAKDLHTSIDKVQLSLTSFFVGIAVGQMIYGPLLDRFGRRIPLIVGLLIYIVFSVILAFTHSVEGLILFRFVQALGSCVGMVASRALVRDYFPPHEMARIFSMLMLVIGVSPILAPTLGGYVVHFFGWQYIFLVLAIIISVVLVGVIFFLPDKRGADRSLSLRPRPIAKGFWEVGKNRQFYTYALSGSLSAAGLYAYLSGSPFVMMELFGVNEREYGWIFGLIAAGLIISSQINGRILRRFQSVHIARRAVIIQALVGLSMIILSVTHLISLPVVIFLVFVYLFCQGFVFPNTSALALRPFEHAAGSASALLGFVQMAIGAVASFLTSFLHTGTELPMLGIMALCTICSCTLILVGSKRIDIV